jgi:DNA-binding transcriptional MerR regulator
MSTNLIDSKELAKLLGISLASVNYYTNLGLFNIEDKKGNKRIYDWDRTLDVYKRIQQLRKEGYPLKLIRERLEKDTQTTIRRD